MAIITKEELKEAFKKADEAGTGKLNFSQLKSLMLALDCLPCPDLEKETKKSIDRMIDLVMKMADINGDKLIDYEELVKFIYDEETDPKEQMREAFRLCDTDRNGFICKKELVEFLKLAGTEMRPTEGSIVMALFDQDGDGKLSYQEFCDLME